MMKKRLTKSSNNVVLTGTLGGIAEFFGIDPTIVRVIFVFFTLFGVGSTIPLYIILAIIMPSGRSNQSGYEQPRRNYHPKYSEPKTRPRKPAEKIDDDDWSDF